VRERFSDGITARDGKSVSYDDRRQRGLRTGPRTGNFYTQGPEARGECLFALPLAIGANTVGRGSAKPRRESEGGVRSLPVAPLAIRFMTFSARCAW
jgi:hypothetical protein